MFELQVHIATDMAGGREYMWMFTGTVLLARVANQILIGLWF